MSKCCRTIKERVHSGKTQDGPRHDGKQPQAQGRGGKSIKKCTIWLQPKEELR